MAHEVNIGITNAGDEIARYVLGKMGLSEGSWFKRSDISRKCSSANRKLNNELNKLQNEKENLENEIQALEQTKADYLQQINELEYQIEEIEAMIRSKKYGIPYTPPIRTPEHPYVKKRKYEEMFKAKPQVPEKITTYEASMLPISPKTIIILMIIGLIAVIIIKLLKKKK